MPTASLKLLGLFRLTVGSRDVVLPKKTQALLTLQLNVSARGRDREIWSQHIDAPIWQSLRLAENIAESLHRQFADDTELVRKPGEASLSGDPERVRELLALAQKMRRTATSEANTETQRALRLAASIDPNNSDVLALLATTHITLNIEALKTDGTELTEAQSELTRALSLDPANVLALWAQCELYRWQERYDEAMTACRKALAINPGYPAALRDMGFILLATGKPAEAAYSFTAAIKAAPDHHFVGAAQLGAGVAELALDRTDDGIASLRESVRHDFPGNNAGIWLAAALDLAGRHDEATAARAEFRQRHSEFHDDAEYLWPAQNTAFMASSPHLIASLQRLGFYSRPTPVTSVY